jgi:small subunit ribosomal protein S1
VEVGSNDENAAPVVRLADLKPKQQLNGVVTRIELFGAFIDVGADREGLVHISQLKPGRVNRVEDVVQTGQPVTVWVRKVDAKAGRLDLTLIQPIAVEWDELKPGTIFHGKVTRVEKFGVFVDIGAERPGLVHVSELAEGYVGHPGEVSRVGDELDVRVLGVDRKKRQINLSAKALVEAEPEEDLFEEEDQATAMEVALREAMKEDQNPRRALRMKKRAARRRAPEEREREEIFARTLRHHRERDDS